MSNRSNSNNIVERSNVWIRIAGHGENIRNKKPHRWRAFLKNGHGWEEEIPLLDWKIMGQASSRNTVAATNSEKNENGLVAWIDYYGRVGVRGDTAYIQLLDPEKRS